MAQIDGQYMDKLVADTAKALDLKKNGTVLGIGDGEWQFTKAVAGKFSEVKSVLVADKSQERLQDAEASGLMTSACEITDLEQLPTLGKYDGVIVKEVLERFLSTEGSSLEDFLFALYKTVRLKGKAIFVSRLRPTIPLPPSVLEQWQKTVPSGEELVKEATECGFTPSHQRLEYLASVDAAVWKAHLLNGGGTKPIPFINSATPDEINKYMASQSGAKISFKDAVDIVVLTKIITRSNPPPS